MRRNHSYKEKMCVNEGKSFFERKKETQKIKNEFY